MNRRDIVIGVLILLLISAVVYFRQRNQTPDNLKVPQTLSSTVEENLEEKFKIQIPDEIDKAELKDTGGGAASAIATRKYEGGKFTLSVLADLPEPAQGSHYQGWLVKGEEGKEGYSLISMGRLQSQKGGWMQTFQSGTDYTDHTKIMVSQEKISDKSVEDKKLEGSF